MQHIDHGVFTFVYDTNFGMKTMGKNKICTILMPLLCWNFFFIQCSYTQLKFYTGKVK